MKVSNFFILALLALLIGGITYWYQSEGSDLFDKIKKSDRKPFLLNQFD